MLCIPEGRNEQHDRQKGGTDVDSPRHSPPQDQSIAPRRRPNVVLVAPLRPARGYPITAPLYNPVVRIVTSAPTRIDLAGGTIDIWPLYLFHPGAQTLNAAISLRARATIESRADERVVINSLDTGVTIEAEGWQELRGRRELRLLSLLAHFFEARGITLTTSCESPAGAGIAGSSALNVAVCSAFAEWNHTHYEPEALLQIAMNIEAQAINVPTGLQDYRPALYGGIAALELGVDGIRRIPLDVDGADLESRIVLCYTGEPRNSGTNNWEIVKKHVDGDTHVFACFERIRDTAAAMREALAAGDWDRVGRAIAEEWDNRKRLAPGVTTPAIEALIARAMGAGATAAKVCGAGGGGCLFCYGPPERRDAIRDALAAGGARVLDYTIERHGLTRG
ncbi:MAG: GHMP kinase [Acidobacteria bacterium]|nr:GHMP kinase [Acidobacteriota bacterium]